jgi:PadR family transcriptional regulator, regulatory protein PadR
MIVPTATMWIVCEQTTTGSTIGGTQQDVLLLSNRTCAIISMAIPYEGLHMTAAKSDVRQGTLALMVLKTLQSMGSLHGYGIARRIEQTSGNRLAVNYGTLYPALLKLEQEGYISSEWGVSDNNRRAKYYKLTQAGRKQVEREVREWEQTNAILARFLAPESETQ